jgi:glycosyltransferase involved in cell wall biosynthesis
MNPSVSVIIPAFDSQAYLGEALTSVVSQSIRDIEVIIVDDGSTDATFEVVKTFDDRRLRYIRQDRAGAAAARNRGIDLAKSRFLAFLDADDLWIGDKLRLQIASLLRADGDMIFANVEEFISDDRVEELEGKVKVHTAPRPGIWLGTLLMRRDDFRRVGPFDLRWRMGEFVEWHARAIDLGLRPFVLPQVLARRRLHNDNMGRRDRAERGQYAQIIKGVLDRRRAAL